ncbi:MAG: T9SS type A sorting domain-containing protein, partial [candidate division Zixibacteria bacterium]|nr:T9SS type A sorting domain-containing protein [candidate division Zixibacteria bacterium]
SGAFFLDTTVRVIVEGTQADFRYGECDTCVRIDQEDPEEPKYIVNLHTNFKHWDYGFYIGTEYWIKTFLNEVLAHKARVIVVEPPGHASKAANVPEAFSLSQNSPNPFNPICEIAYALPTDCQVTLSIYNILGQKVRVLVDEYQDAGHKSVKWDGKDEQGQEVTSGVYFYRIQAGDFAQSKKMVLIR